MRTVQSEDARGPRYGLFVSLKKGLQSLVQKVTEKLPPAHIRLGSEVRAIYLSGEASKRFKLVGHHFEDEADAICLSLPACRSAKILKSLNEKLSSELEKISYASAITVNLIYET